VEASHHLILLGSALVLLSIFAGVFSARLGAPLLVVFLGLGMLAGEEGLGGIVFRDFHAAYLIGSISLAIILFEGGLRTDPGAIRRALWPSLALATLGVIATAAIVGAAAVLLFSTSWIRGLLIGAIIAPTDAAAVSALLHLRGLELRAHVAGTLELESGINDPISVLLTVLLVNLLLAPAPLTGPYIATLLAREVLGGAVFGIGGGYLLLALINRLEATSGLYPILALAGATVLFGSAQTAGASAFIIVLTSLIVQGWTVAAAARIFDLDVPPLQQASRLDIDLPGPLGDENTVAGYRVEARCRAVSKGVEALPLPPTANVLVVIRDGIARSAGSAPPLAPGDYVLALARPEDLALLDRLFGQRSRADDRGLLGEFAFDGTAALAAIAHLYDPGRLPMVL
jgi:NhaP-type Na+/H+ and K+/H+ antiporter